ncbi:RHS repeat-associated core domain-containing protein [Paracidovorax anthurii]|uniref:RHS repeat-associated protein n=1 Tax=Paracidovorax anthurii TaxID=78229 RepID=A0A328ZDY6_9BURK|nr:RHS repeat-associated core domain-containing protein [Paracidovorax anthurii]RAR80987.1 RHS repeat-associated protein [Paracidovorax anthurii]
MSTYPAAARRNDPIAHSNANSRLLAKVVGIAAGAAVLGAVCAGTIAAGVAAGLSAVGTVVSGGLAAPILAGAVIATGALATLAVSVAGGNIGEKIADYIVPETWEVKGKITSGSPDVFINGRPAARATDAVPLDEVYCSDHHVRPVNLIAQGAAQGPRQTLINDALAARKGDRVVCGAAIHEGSSNVFIGGAPATVRDYDEEASIWLRGLLFALEVRRFYKNIKCLWNLARDPKAVLQSVPCILQAAQAAGSAAMTLPAILGRPVHVASGAKLLGDGEDLDFVLPGVLPIVWQRIYNSLDYRPQGPFGQGWSTPYCQQLHLGTGPDGVATITYFDGDGRDITFDAPPPGEGQFSVAEGMGILCSEGGDYLAVTAEGHYQWFGKAQDALPGGIAGGGVLQLRRVEDRNGNFHALRYDAQHRLAHLADSAGRLLAFEYFPDSRRLRQIALRIGAQGEAPEVLARYEHHGDLRSLQAQLAQVTDRNGEIVRRFAYEQGHLVHHQLPTGLNCHYAWQRFDADLGARSGPHWRVVRHWTDDGADHRLAYDLAARTTQVTDAQGRTCRWRWNGDHEITEYTDALGATWKQEYNALRQLLRHVDPLGQATAWAYDDTGNPVAETDPLGRTQRWRWTPGPASLLQSSIDPAGGAWSYRYDDHGNLLAETDPLGHTTTYANDDQGLPIVITDAHGGRKRLQWDARGLPTVFTDCSGQATRFAYDQRGHLREETNALGQTTRTEHDALGRLLRIALPDGASHAWRYNAAGQCVQASDALGRTTHYSYNARGQLLGRTRTVGGLASTIHLGYDAAHRLAALVNENRQTYQFAYDAADRQVSETRIDGSHQALERDAAGQVVGITEYPMPPGAWDDVAGHAPVQPIHTRLERDEAGQLVGKRIFIVQTDARAQIQAMALQAHLTYRYTPTGELAETEELTPAGRRLSRHAWQYDRLGQLLREDSVCAIGESGGAHAGLLQHAYDALGNRIATVMPDGRTVNYLHYGSGHLHQINLDGIVVSDFERDGLHREVLRTQGRLASRFAHDGVGRRTATWVRPALLRVESGTGGPGVWNPGDADWTARLRQPGLEDTLLKRYGHDANGELVHEEHSSHGTTVRSYDEAGRIVGSLTQRHPALQENFHFDPAGNRIGALEAQSLATQGRGWVRHNRVKVLQDKRYDYDGFGRLIRLRIGAHVEQHFRYDAQHRMTHAAVIRAGKDGEPLRQVFRYHYDSIGRRVAKEDDFGATLFTWESMRLLQERRGEQCTTYLYEPDSYVPLARIDGAGAIEAHPAARHAFGHDTRAGKQASVPNTNPDWSDRFNVAAANDPQDEHGASPPPTGRPPGSATALIYYFHVQPNGQPEEMSDAQGNLVWRAQFRTWGATVQEHWQAFDAAGRPVDALVAETGHQAQASPSPMPQNLRMQGQYLDRETGLHYNTFRYYSPDLGAFTTPDPIGLAGGLNLHQYAPNPIAWIDPLGWACIQQKIDGTRREERVGAKLRAVFGKDNVLRERALRNAKGERVRDNSSGGDGTGRNIDYVVKGKDGKWRPVEVTSKSADKTAQLSKERAIRNQGGTFVRLPGSKVLVPVEGTSRVIRVE